MQTKRSPLEKLQQSWQTAFNTENRAFTLDVLKVLISAFGVLATVFAGVGLYLTYRTSQAQLEAAQQERQLNSERLVTDRFAKAVEQLGSQDIDVRIGGIYSLERIAKDSPKDHWTLIEVLTAFVRNKAPLPKDWKPDSKQKLSDVATDVQSALTVLGRREHKNDPELKYLDLSRANLSETNLEGAYLVKANLEGANLRRAILLGANLNEARLWGDANLSDANLSGAYLISANLGGANLKNANLNGADLTGANLSDANLEGADLTGAHFSNTTLRNTDLHEAKFKGVDLKSAFLQGAKNITPTQIKAANNWQDAHYDPAFRQQLGLPPEKLQP